MNEWMNGWIKQLTLKWTKKLMNGGMTVFMNEWVNGWMTDCMNERMLGRMNTWMMLTMNEVQKAIWREGIENDKYQWLNE